MKATFSLAKRVILLFFRDKANVFYSLLGSIIMLVLYMLFLNKAWTDEKVIAVMPTFMQFQGQWLMAGITFITCFSTSLNAMGQLPYDNKQRISDDLNVTPISRSKIVAGYWLGAIACAAIMTVFTIAFTYLYLLVKGHAVPGVAQSMIILAIATLCIIMNCAFGFMLASSAATPRSYGSISSVLITLLGFLVGVYVPIGAMGKTTQMVLTLLPFTHGAALLRLPFTRETLSAATNPQSASILSWARQFLGIDLAIGSFRIEPWVSMVYMAVMSLVFFTISVRNLSKSKKV